MRVILLSSTPPPVGGIASWTMRMLNATLKDNWEIKLVDEKIIGGREMFGGKIKYSIINEVKRWGTIWKKLHVSLKDRECKAVHACPTADLLSMLAELTSGIITRIHGRDFIVHFRCTVPNMINSRLQKIVLHLLCAVSTHIIVLNSQSEQYLSAITKTKLHLIPNFIEEEYIRKNRSINKSVHTAVYVGGVIETKGCKTIIDMARNNPDIEFRLIGRAEESLISYAENCKNVVFTGVKSKSEVQIELDNADLFLFLSFYPGEGFSNALVEAMGAGLPCIVTDWAANADMIDDRRGGLVVPCNDSKSANDALNTIREYSLRKEYSQYNIQKVLSCYTSKSVIDQYVDIYNECNLSWRNRKND